LYADSHQELAYESQQWWQTYHLWTKAYYLFMQQWIDGSHDWWHPECTTTCFIFVTIVEIHSL